MPYGIGSAHELLQLLARAGDYMGGKIVRQPARGGSGRLYGGLDGAHITLHLDGDQAAHLFDLVTYQRYIGGFQGRIGSLYPRCEPFCLYQSQGSIGHRIPPPSGG